MTTAAATTETGMGAGGQGIPMTTSPAQYAQTQYQQQPQQQPQQQYQGQHQHQGQHHQGGHMGGFQNVANAPMQIMSGKKSKESPAVTAMMMQPDEPNATEGCNIFLAVMIPLCAVTSTILAGLAGSETVDEAVGWRLAVSATVITAVGIVGFEVLKRLFANTSVEEAENATGIAVLANANIRAVAVKALAVTFWEVKKAEWVFRDIELFVVVTIGLVAAILSGVSAVFFNIKVLAVISAFLNALAGAFLVLFDILANGKKQVCKNLEDQLRRNNLVADFLRADPSRKHTLLQDRVEQLNMA